MNINKLNEISTALNDVDQVFTALKYVLGSGMASYYFEQLKGYYQGCMEASLFKTGDRVRLCDDIDVTESPGWKASSHFLIKGATGTIAEYDYSPDKGYVYMVIIDNQTRIGHNGEHHIIKNPYTFEIRQNCLELAPQTTHQYPTTRMLGCQTSFNFE